MSMFQNALSISKQNNKMNDKKVNYFQKSSFNRKSQDKKNKDGSLIFKKRISKCQNGSSQIMHCKALSISKMMNFRTKKQYSMDIDFKKSPYFNNHNYYKRSIKEIHKSKRLLTQHNNLKARNNSPSYKVNEILAKNQKKFKNVFIFQKISKEKQIQFITPEFILNQFKDLLTDYQKIQILSYKQIYYFGQKSSKQRKGIQNNGFDDKKGNYMLSIGDHIAYRYELTSSLGRGSFGHVYKAYDHKNKQHVALKIIRNKKKFNKQAQIQLDILNTIRQKNSDNTNNIIKLKDYHVFRKHMVTFSKQCLIFQLLSINLYQLINHNQFQPLPQQLIRRFAIQILNALTFLAKQNIIHCDLKPQNILMKNPNKSGIKIIDFGSSCYTDKIIHNYIQSRYYRAPQIILGYPYSIQIDMWSTACIIAQLHIGYPIFPGQDESQQIIYFTQFLGVPPRQYYMKSQRGQCYFKDNNLAIVDKEGNVRIPNSRPIEQIIKIDGDFVDFLKKCFTWQPYKRMNPVQGLRHRWILKGLPQDIKIHHLKQLEIEQKHFRNFQR